MENNHPEIAATISEYYMPAKKSAAECGAADDAVVTYIASWIGQADVQAEKSEVKVDKKYAVLIDDENIRGTNVRWENYSCDAFGRDDLESRPEFADAEYQQPAAWMMDAKLAKTYESNFIDWIARDADVHVRVNKKLGINAFSEDVTEDEFIDMCKEKVAEKIEKEVEKLKAAAETKIDAAQSKLDKAMVTLSDKQTESRNRKIQTAVTAGEAILGLFGVGRKKSASTAVNKAGQISKASNAAEKAQMDVDALTAKLEELQNDLETKIEEVTDKWNEVAENVSEVRIDVAKKDVYVDYFGICWMPYYKNSVGKLVRAY